MHWLVSDLCATVAWEPYRGSEPEYARHEIAGTLGGIQTAGPT